MKIKMEIFPQKNYPTKPFWGFPFGPSVPKAGSDYMGLVCTYTNLFHKAHMSEKLVWFFWAIWIWQFIKIGQSKRQKDLSIKTFSTSFCRNVFQWHPSILFEFPSNQGQVISHYKVICVIKGVMDHTSLYPHFAFVPPPPYSPIWKGTRRKFCTFNWVDVFLLDSFRILKAWRWWKEWKS